MFFHRRGIDEDDHHHAAQLLRLYNRLDLDIDVLGAAVGSDLEAADNDGRFLPQRLLEGADQFKAQPFPGHGEDIPVGLAGGRFEIFAGASADIDDVALVIGQHGRR